MVQKRRGVLQASPITCQNSTSTSVVTTKVPAPSSRHRRRTMTSTITDVPAKLGEYMLKGWVMPVFCTLRR